MRKTKGSPQPFGVDIKGKNINFAVQVAKGKTCELLLYKRGKEVPEYQFDMPEEEGVGEVRFLSVEGLKADRYEYNFLIDGKVCVDLQNILLRKWCIREHSRGLLKNWII